MSKHKINEIFPLFSSPVGFFPLKLHPDNIIAARELLKKEELKQANLQGTHISVNKKLLDQEDYFFIKRAVSNAVKEFVNKSLLYKPVFKMTSSWLAKVEPGYESLMHQHSNCAFSSVCYITVPENSGNITFASQRPVTISIPTYEYNVFNSVEYSFKPIENTILIFPSHLFHKIEKNMSNHPRLSIACNFMPMGKVGIGDSEYRYQ
jgi:uncharacterized protein (TIGR02466 family)